MKTSRSIIALAIAGTFACAGAYAGGTYHSEVQTPANISESAPWQSGHSHLAGWSHPSDTTLGFQEGQHSDGPYGTGTGVSSDSGGSGSGSFESNPTGYDHSRSDAESAHDHVAVVDYWLIVEPAQIDAIADDTAMSAFGSGGYDASFSDSGGMHTSVPYSFEVALTEDELQSLHNEMNLAWADYAIDAGAVTDEPLAVLYTPSAQMIAENFGPATPLLSEHYLMVQSPSEFDAGNLIVLELGTAGDDVALLQALSSDFYVLTPAYEEG